MKDNQLICIVGPTAVGKTAISIRLAKELNCPIISADSRQIYKEMSIGTAKPSLAEQDGIPHFFINSHSIHQAFSVGDYEKDAIELLDKLFTNFSKIVLVGGSGLFVKALIEGLDYFPPISSKTREYVQNMYDNHGLEYIQKLLLEHDAESYYEIEIKNYRRVMRALEIYFETGEKLSGFKKKNISQRTFNTQIFGLNLPREFLNQRINRRVDIMFEQGLLNEAQSLYQFKSLSPLNTVGYVELFDYFDQKLSLEDAKEAIKRNTRVFAKKQVTWFKKQAGIEWFEPEQYQEILRRVQN